MKFPGFFFPLFLFLASTFRLPPLFTTSYRSMSDFKQGRPLNSGAEQGTAEEALPLHSGTKSSAVSTTASTAASSSFQILLLTLMVLQNSATVLVGRYSQSRPGGATFKTSSLVAVVEMTKMIVCLFAITLENLPPPHTSTLSPTVLPLLPRAFFQGIATLLSSPSSALAVSPPAFLYLVQNNILFVALKNLSAPVFQVTYQSKLVTTAFVSVLLLNRTYQPLQWLSLLTLSTGVAVVVLGEAKGEGGGESLAEGQSIGVGLVAVAAASLSSAFAGVYFEKVLKVRVKE